MTIADFDAATPDEFTAITAAYYAKVDRQSRESWMQTRKICMFVCAGYAKSMPEESKLMPFPWDNDKEKEEPVERSTQADFERAKKMYE